jgi:hypothetical protein
LKGRIAVAFAGLSAAVAIIVPLSSAAGDGDSTGSQIAGTAFSAVSADTAPTHDGNARVVETKNAPTFTLDDSALSAQLDEAPAATTANASRRAATTPAPAQITLPAPDGSTQTFALTETRVMAPQLAAEHPEIQTYAGQGIDDPASSVRITDSPLGFQASVRGGELGSWYVDPVYHLDRSLYASYYGPDLANRHGPLGELAPKGKAPAAARISDSEARAAGGPSNGTQLRTYRLGLISEPGYAKYFGGPANVTAAKVALMNRVDQVYEDELSIQMVLIGANDDLNLDTYADAIAPNGPCGTDPCYSQEEITSCSGNTLDRNRTVAGQIVGADKFDIAHIALGRAGGGIAGLGVVGTQTKASGCTGIPKPDGDFYAVDYVAHEMGHQFSGNHTFNGNQVNCSGGNRNGGTSVEPGSGTSIMAYAGICGQDNLQPHSDPYFSQRSFQEITAYTSGDENAVSETQSVALRHFGGGNEAQTATFGPGFNEDSSAGQTSSFKLSYNGNQSVVIGGDSGAPFTNSGIKAAIEGIPGFPAGGTVTVSGAGATATTFSVTFGGTLAGTDVPSLQLVGLTSCASCFGSIEETRHGGSNDSFKLSYNGTDSSTITRGTTYNTVGLQAALLQILPSGTTATVGGFGSFTTPNERGFEIDFSGTSAIPHLVQVTNASPGTSGFTNRTDAGGPAANKGNTITPTGNTPPAVTAPDTFTIPHRTPFPRTGSASDADNDPLTYMWEQNDRGLTANALVNPNKLSGPLFRQFGTRLDMSVYDEHAYDSPGENHTTADPSRTLPDIKQILANNTDAETGDCPGAPAPDPPATGGATNVPDKLADCYSEFLPKAAYTGPMHFRLTVRDGRVGGGGVASADTTVRLAPATGPFLVISPNAAISWAGGSAHDVTWDVAGTKTHGIGADDVKISLSTDGGQTFPTVLAASTPNDGSQSVTLPNVSTTQARIKVEAVGNIFFDLSDADFRIGSGSGPVTTSVTGNKAHGKYGHSAKLTVKATDSDSKGSDLTAKAEGLPKGFTLEKVSDSGAGALPGKASFEVAASPVTAKPGTYESAVTVKDGNSVTGAVTIHFLIKKAKPKLRLSAKPSPLESGNTGVFTAKLRAPGSAIKPKGEVSFKLGSRKLGKAKVRDGVATIRAAVKGAHRTVSLKATYGDAGGRFKPSSESRKLRIR